MKSYLLATLFILALSHANAQTNANPRPLVHAHAHNDYLHPRPLLDAIDRGFSSIEADVFLVEGKLLVAHERASLRPERTLEALYLDPLLERVRVPGGGGGGAERAGPGTRRPGAAARAG